MYKRQQLVIRQVKAAGQGDLQARFLELKEKLQREGLFDAERKQGIPAFPRAIGIVTSPTGAVIQDIRHVLELSLIHILPPVALIRLYVPALQLTLSLFSSSRLPFTVRAPFRASRGLPFTVM